MNNIGLSKLGRLAFYVVYVMPYRYPGSIAKFKMLRHDLVPENPELSEMSERSKKRKLDQDGVSSVEYELEEVEYLPLHTSIKISLRPPPVKVNSKSFRSLSMFRTTFHEFYILHRSLKAGW